MGTDMHGFIECRWDRWLDEEDRRWDAAIDLAHLYAGRSYAAFGALFGVRDTASFLPLAADRGLPRDVSDEARAGFDGWGRDAHGASWVTWAELTAVDWDEGAAEVDECVHEYRRGPEGSWELYGRNSSLTRFAEVSGLSGPRDLYRAGRTQPEGSEWYDGDRLFRVGRLTRKQAVPDSDWEAVWAVMRTLAGLHGDEGVRLVVWFDC
ncbi:hypothetical protein ACFVYT_06630 [Streptomyces sp. NPDC058290]|uniref:hypothetical protein n=1 Tax=Streptomyces sp. NPDC058290 TaxID=3346426 RepID=UPI0036EAA512